MSIWNKCCSGCDMDGFCLYQQTDDVESCEEYSNDEK
jgi:hypothetical protein